MTLEIRRPEQLREPPRAVIFDTDNTLYSYNHPHAKATAAVEEKVTKLLGIAPPVFREAFTKARAELKERLKETASSHSRLLYFQRTIEILGMRTQLLITLDLEQTYWRTLLMNAELFPNVRDFILDLKADGINTAIITDLTSQIQFRKIIYFGLDDCFDYVVTSEEAGADKPHPAPFEMALDKLKIDPACIWMIGDDPISDIHGARAFDMTTFQKRHDGVVIHKSEDGPDVIFDDFRELQQLITSMEQAMVA